MDHPAFWKPVTVTEERVREAMLKQEKQRALREGLDAQIRQTRKMKEITDAINGDGGNGMVVGQARRGVPGRSKRPSQPSLPGPPPPKSGDGATTQGRRISDDVGGLFLRGRRPQMSVGEEELSPGGLQNITDPRGSPMSPLCPPASKPAPEMSSFTSNAMCPAPRYQSNSLPPNFAMTTSAGNMLVPASVSRPGEYVTNSLPTYAHRGIDSNNLGDRHAAFYESPPGPGLQPKALCGGSQEHQGRMQLQVNTPTPPSASKESCDHGRRTSRISNRIVSDDADDLFLAENDNNGYQRDCLPRNYNLGDVRRMMRQQPQQPQNPQHDVEANGSPRTIAPGGQAGPRAKLGAGGARGPKGTNRRASKDDEMPGVGIGLEVRNTPLLPGKGRRLSPISSPTQSQQSACDLPSFPSVEDVRQLLGDGGKTAKGGRTPLGPRKRASGTGSSLVPTELVAPQGPAHGREMRPAPPRRQSLEARKGRLDGRAGPPQARGPSTLHARQRDAGGGRAKGSDVVQNKLKKMQQDLETHQHEVNMMRERERAWEEQVKQLKLDLRNARQKEAKLSQLVSQRAETAPNQTTVKLHRDSDAADAVDHSPRDRGGAHLRFKQVRTGGMGGGGRGEASGFHRRVSGQAPPAPQVGEVERRGRRVSTEGGSDGESDAPEMHERFLGQRRSKPSGLEATHKFRSSSFRPTSAPLEDISNTSSPFSGAGAKPAPGRRPTKTMGTPNASRPLRTPPSGRLQPMYDDAPHQLSSFDTQRAALGLSDGETATRPVFIEYEHLLQFAVSQLISHRQAEELWVLFTGGGSPPCGQLGPTGGGEPRDSLRSLLPPPVVPISLQPVETQGPASLTYYGSRASLLPTGAGGPLVPRVSAEASTVPVFEDVDEDDVALALHPRVPSGASKRGTASRDGCEPQRPLPRARGASLGLELCPEVIEEAIASEEEEVTAMYLSPDPALADSAAGRYAEDPSPVVDVRCRPSARHAVAGDLEAQAASADATRAPPIPMHPRSQGDPCGRKHASVTSVKPNFTKSTFETDGQLLEEGREEDEELLDDDDDGVRDIVDEDELDSAMYAVVV